MLQETWWLFLASAFGAEVIGTTAGFGAATVLTPVAMLFMDVKAAIAVVAWFHLFGNASRLVFFGRQIHWKTWAQFGLIGILCSFFGARLSAHLPSSALRLIFGVFLLLYAGLSRLRSDPVRLPATPATLATGGMASGFIAGLIGTGGALRSACLLSFGLPKEVYIGTSAAIALVVDATRLPVYLVGRFIPASMGPVICSLVLAAFAGSWVGQRLVRRISAAAFHRVVQVVLALAGLKLAIDGWRGL